MPEPEFTSADFHNVVQKQILHTVPDTLAASKLEWKQIVPFLQAAREKCGSDFQSGASIRLHTVRAEGEAWVDAEEAYLGISVADREDGTQWLSETYWLSDIARAEGVPEQVRRIVAALERTVAKLNAWLAESPKVDPPKDEGPAESA